MNGGSNYDSLGEVIGGWGTCGYATDVVGSEGERSKVSDFDSENMSRLRLILSRLRKIAFLFCGCGRAGERRQ